MDILQSLASDRGLGVSLRQVGVGLGGQRDQLMRVIADHFGGDILGDGQLSHSVT